MVSDVDRLTEKRNDILIDARIVRKHTMKFYWRLKSYEDTGLTPEEIMSLKSDICEICRDRANEIGTSAYCMACKWNGKEG